MTSVSLETKTQRLHRLLSDGEWHSTRELVRRVGHTFAVAKFKLVQAGCFIAKRRILREPHQWEYRLTTHGHTA